VRLGHAITVLLSLFGLVTVGVSTDAAGDNWPSWRGSNSNGVAENADPPVTWSETKNIKWKVAIPGDGESTPIIWGDKIFLQTAVPTAEKSSPASDAPRSIAKIPTAPLKFNVLCLDRETGALLWERTAREEIPHEGRHPTGSFSSYSPVTDGELLWASFGSRGLHCYDLDGNHQWSDDLIQMQITAEFGEGSSPVLAGDAVIVLMDHEGESKIFAFNKKTGDPLWEQDRDEPSSWTSPVAVEVEGAYQVITNAKNYIRSYDAQTGELIWQIAGRTDGPIPSPVAAFGNVYCAGGYREYSIMAIELGHTGDLSDTDALVWHTEEESPYVATPLIYDENMYVITGYRGQLSCFDAQTGKRHYTGQRLEGVRQIYASPTGAGGRVYIAGRKGTTVVVKHSTKFEVLATNVLDDGFDASPVVVGDELYLRGEKYLYCIAEK